MYNSVECLIYFEQLHLHVTYKISILSEAHINTNIVENTNVKDVEIGEYLYSLSSLDAKDRNVFIQTLSSLMNDAEFYQNLVLVILKKLF